MSGQWMTFSGYLAYCTRPEDDVVMEPLVAAEMGGQKEGLHSRPNSGWAWGLLYTEMEARSCEVLEGGTAPTRKSTSR